MSFSDSDYLDFIKHYANSDAYSELHSTSNKAFVRKWVENIYDLICKPGPAPQEFIIELPCLMNSVEWFRTENRYMAPVVVENGRLLTEQITHQKMNENYYHMLTANAEKVIINLNEVRRTPVVRIPPHDAADLLERIIFQPMLASCKTIHDLKPSLQWFLNNPWLLEEKEIFYTPKWIHSVGQDFLRTYCSTLNPSHTELTFQEFTKEKTLLCHQKTDDGTFAAFIKFDDANQFYSGMCAHDKNNDGFNGSIFDNYSERNRYGCYNVNDILEYDGNEFYSDCPYENWSRSLRPAMLDFQMKLG